MNQKFIRSIVLSSIVLGATAMGANATGLTESVTGKALPSQKFYEIVGKTKPNQVAVNFGAPDTIATIRDTSGKVSGVVWTYKNAVASQDKKLDANFVLVNGQFKYVTLSNAS
jgi:hypothetical protein